MLPVTLPARIRLLRWAFPFALAVLVALYQLGLARWVHDRYSDPVHFGVEILFYGTGGGIDVATPVGPVRLTLGYKLNASPFDLRRSDEVLAALLEGRPLDSVPVRKLQRFHVHLSLGQPF